MNKRELTLKCNRGIVFAPGERDVYSFGPPPILPGQPERFRNDCLNSPGDFAPAELKRAKLETLDYKHVAPLGREPTT